MVRFLRLARKAGWAITDQGMYALSNLVVSIILARLLDRERFGAYATAFLIFSIAVAVERAIVGQPLQIKLSGSTDEVFRSALRGAMGTAVLIGLVGSAVCLTVWQVGQDVLGPSMVALALTMPILLLHDAGRMACYARTDAKGAALLDLSWNLLLAVALAALILTSTASLFSLTLAWGGSAAVGVLIAWRRLGVMATPFGALRWLRDQSDLWAYLLGEYVIGLGAAQLAILLAGALTTATEVGFLRGAQVILGPLGILATAAFQFAIPEISKRAHLSARYRARMATLLSGALCAVVPVYVGILVLVPDDYGQRVFGETWVGARHVLVPMAIAAFFSTLGSGPAVILYSLGKARLTFWLHAAKAPMLLAGIVVGSVKFGALGAAWTLAITEALMLPAWIAAMMRVLATVDESQSAEGDESSSVSVDPAMSEASAMLPGGELDQAAEFSGPAGPDPSRGRHRKR